MACDIEIGRALLAGHNDCALRRWAVEAIAEIECLKVELAAMRIDRDRWKANAIETWGVLEKMASPRQSVTIHTPTGEIVQRIDGVILSDTTHAPPADATIHSIPMPYMPGGVGVTLGVSEQASIADERREMEKRQ